METVTQLNNEAIKLTGKDIDNRLFNVTINRLCQFQFSDPKLAYNINYISDKIKKFTKEIMMEHGKLLDKYAEKEEGGNFLLDDNKNISIKDEDQAKYKADLESAHEIEFEIRKKKLDVNVLSEAGFALSANDISVLEPLLCGLED